MQTHQGTSVCPTPDYNYTLELPKLSRPPPCKDQGDAQVLLESAAARRHNAKDVVRNCSHTGMPYACFWLIDVSESPYGPFLPGFPAVS